MEELEESQAQLGEKFRAQVDALNTWLSANKATLPEIICDRNLEHLEEWYAYSLESLEIRMAKARKKLDLNLNLSKKLRQEMLKGINEEEKTEKVKLRLRKDEKRQELELERDQAEMKPVLERLRVELKQNLERLRVELEQDLEREQAELEDQCKQKQVALKAKFDSDQADMINKRELNLVELKAKLVRDQAEKDKDELKLLNDKVTNLNLDLHTPDVELHSIGTEQEKEKLKLKSQKDLEETFERRRVDLEWTSKRELAALGRDYDHERAMLNLDLRSQKEEKVLDLKFKVKRMELDMGEKCQLFPEKDCLLLKQNLEKQAADERKHNMERKDKERDVKKSEVQREANIDRFLDSIRNKDVLEDKELTVAGGVCPEEVVKCKILRLPAGVRLGGMRHLAHLDGKMLVRACYENLCALLFETCQIGGDEENSTVENRFVIMGNPGIGKSLFSYYLLYCLMQAKVTVVWQPYRSSCRILIVPDQDIQFGDVSTGFGTELSSSSTWYIVDAVEPDSVNANIVLISSPKKETIKQFQKTAMSLCMPVWSKEEIDLAVQLGLAKCRSTGPPLSSEHIKDTFDLFGGIPRYVFEYSVGDMKDKKNDLTEAAKKAARFLIDGTINLLSEVGNPEITSHLVIKLVPRTEEGPNRYRRYRLEFISTRVDEIVDECARALKEADLLSFLNRCGEFNSFATFSGTAFEIFVHHRFWSGGRFKVRKLVKETHATPEDEIELEYSTMKPFGSIEDLTAQPNTYWVPSARNYEAIDSLKGPDMIFQITIRKYHPVSKQRIVETAARLRTLFPGGGDHVIRFYFVVPHFRFKTYKLQSYLDANNHVEVEENNHVPNVEQYVLSVGFDVATPVKPEK